MSETMIKESSIMKTLLLSPSSSGELRRKYQSYNSTESEDCGGLKLSNHLHNAYKKTIEKIFPFELDHSYCKPWNWRPENIFMKPAENLFMPKPEQEKSDEEIEVVEDDVVWKPFYDVNKAKVLMDECKKHISLVRADEGDPFWDQKVDRVGWTVAQNRLFDRTCRILNNDRLGRLAISQHHNEPVLRRIQVNKSSRRFRSLMSIIYWDPKLMQWLHNTLLDTLETNYLVAYVDILQSLKSKIPTLIERLLQSSTTTKTNPDALNVLVQRPWDPASLIYPAFSLRKLPGNPVLLLVPGTPGIKARPNRWLPYLSQLGTLVTVTTNNAINSGKITLISSLEHMLASTRMKLTELRKENPNRQIILIGINSGSALACQVALLDFVSGIVCLGFPIKTVEGIRGQPDDNLTTLQVPILFVIGQHAASCSIDDVEEVRERLSNCETGLIIVGGGDDQLRVPKSMQHIEGVTQHVIDRCIIEEVGDFLGQIGTKKEEHLMSRNRAKIIESRKRKISIQDVDPPRSTPLTTGSNSSIIGSQSDFSASNNINNSAPRRGRRPRGPRGGRGNIGRWGNRQQQQMSVSPTSSSSTIPLVKFPQVRGRFPATPRPTENILKRQIPDSSTNPSSNSSAILMSDILQHSVVGSDSGVSSSTDGFNMESGSLIEQLTPDRLLEMPIIIAQDDSAAAATQPTQVKQIVVRQANKSPRSGIKCLSRGISKNKGNTLNCAKIILRKKDQPTTSSVKSSVVTLDISSDELSKIGSSSKTRVFHIPASKHSNI